MNGPGDEPLTRRGWGVATARGLALGGIAWMAGSLALRRGCIRSTPLCGNCEALSECRLSEAMVEKKRQAGDERHPS